MKSNNKVNLILLLSGAAVYLLARLCVALLCYRKLVVETGIFCAAGAGRVDAGHEPVHTLPAIQLFAS